MSAGHNDTGGPPAPRADARKPGRKGAQDPETHAGDALAGKVHEAAPVEITARDIAPNKAGCSPYTAPKTPPSGKGSPGAGSPPGVYGALDLGTNNCRLLIARPAGGGFRVIDAFSRIVRLGEGLSHTRCLSKPAMDRTIEALKICTEKLARRNVSRSRLIATEACRIAHNGAEFIDRVYRETGLKIEVIDRETEARLAVAGSASLIDRHASRALVFDIGGGSSELMWLHRAGGSYEIKNWISLPIGVVTLAEHHECRDVTREIFTAMMDEVEPHLEEFERMSGGICIAENDGHMLGTSGTVTTIAGVAMGLARYDRRKIDGCWLTDETIDQVTGHLISMNFDERAASPCIGTERADLVLAGCAILSAIMRKWPCAKVRVADRGLREGILTSLMRKDGHLDRGAKRRGRGRHRRRQGSRGRSHPYTRS